MTPKFEWDSRKAAPNLRRHGVSFGGATGVFCNPFARIFDDEDHTIEYPMMISRCSSKRNRLLLVSITHRESAIRIISARKATRNERKDYEENVKP